MVSKEIKWWLKASQNDAEAAALLKEKGFYNLAVFHAQQAAEKALKAFCLKYKRPGFSHSCLDLLKKIDSFGVKVPREVTEAARRIDPHYIIARYPNGLAGSPEEYYDQKLATEAEKWMRQILNFVESQP